MQTERISRRCFLSTAAAGVAASVARHSVVVQAKETSLLPKPTKAQQRWQDCEVGLLFHFDLPVAAHRFAPNNMVRERLDPNLYQPKKLDTDQWVAAAKAAGARYAIFTATHFNGFMQWQSDLYPYSLKYTSWRNGKGDVVKDFVESCRKAGILPGVYLSTHRNVYWTVWGHYVNWGKGRGTPAQARFNRVAERMVEELCSRYGPLVQIWFDAGVKTPEEGGPDVLPIFEKYQPDSVFYHSKKRSDYRWVGNERGVTCYPCWATMPSLNGEVSHNSRAWKPLLATGDPNGTYWSPAMVDVPLRGAHGVHSWLWRPGEERGVYPLKNLVDIYYNAVGRNCNLIIGAVVDSDGLVPEGDVKRLEEFGREIKKRFDSPVAETSGAGTLLELKLPKPSKINQVVLMEQISEGERVRSYTLEGLTAGGNWQQLSDGQCIGHKRIELFDKAVEVAAVRLKVTETRGKPLIRRLAVFHV